MKDGQNPAALRLWTGEVLVEWLDYNGHMTEHRYLQVFGESSDALYGHIGVDFANAAAGAYFTLSTHILHRAECKVGTGLWTETEVLGYDARFVHLFHRLFDTDGKLLAEGEHLVIHVQNGKSCPAATPMLEAVAKIFEAQRSLPLPEGSGKVLSRPLARNRLV